MGTKEKLTELIEIFSKDDSIFTTWEYDFLESFDGDSLPNNYSDKREEVISKMYTKYVEGEEE